MSRDTSKPRHHHGDLRNALVQAGIDLLEDGGIEALTLRKCAARAGVSHAAPAHHFGGLPGLRAAIAEEGFRIFSSYMQEARRQGDPSARGQLKSICRGYLRFGLDHAGILTVIFGNQGLASLVPGRNQETADAYQILREVCAPFVPEGGHCRVIEFQVWSLIHGFTLLCLAGEFGPPRQALETGVFDQVIALLEHLGPPDPALRS
ncbi:TetR/AcrR family transcriptional regulator [Tritonibacter horizontis]|uniref:Transcriptional regulator BetI n=1 Tax=Tritonibacter horizontis TaxID=1768241 RepID=A0A132BZC2_9RHOB|nr:TetR/AcrR family transcriptional regulator [Tritonibacter horizontis]KUP93711.1 transcriptional regulator BetI [Tritonibacter horizontis]